MVFPCLSAFLPATSGKETHKAYACNSVCDCVLWRNAVVKENVKMAWNLCGAGGGGCVEVMLQKL